MHDLLVPDSDILLLSASECDGLTAEMAWISDTAGTATWFSDSDASAWLTETEDAWPTDTEGGLLLTDSDAAWFSDSDAVFGDMSSLPPSAVSNWLSDEADVDMDGKVGVTSGANGALDVDAFEEAFAALTDVEPGDSDENIDGEKTTEGVPGVVDYSEFWESIRPFIGANEVGKVPDAGAPNVSLAQTVDQEKLAQEIRVLLSSVVGDVEH
ncbi:hypothetical protein PAXINDRAFT_168953 [Paxillus involutus ATCC 200175]|uniref:Uncharacterized protein n=1 Tax=Paxillus involutus ATCC 200175 TaxID=664439 RepID=A0A0C9TIA6_PAXIN|nr:hypothetical protein PAXINDRAFT_168953 [Paxillus involutus ATCC 200175]